MIKSMTGFGKAINENNGKKITVEIRSLNSKQIDLNFRLPYIYKEKEIELRTELSKQVERGKLDVTIYVEALEEATPILINKSLAKIYHLELKSLAKEFEETNQHLLPLVLKMPEVMKAERETAVLDEVEWKEIKLTVEKAMEAFQQFRSDEGKTLLKEFELRIAIVTNLLSEVIALDKLRIPNIKERIKTNLMDAVGKEKMDANRFEQELIYYIEKLDITEEKLRLKTHLDYFTTTMQEPSNGRKLGFITQEIGREINTIGSKANDSDIQKLVVQMKDEIEKVKEQLLNVL
jgi:uncharacterized protein (TIGR00255 family)